MDDVHAEAELLLKRNIVFKYKFGFLGEAYISYDEFHNDYTQYKELLKKYTWDMFCI